VALGDDHQSAQEADFYAALMRDPRFAREVGNVVVEFGGAAHQDIVDRYVQGENVPYAELQKIWTDVVGWIPTVTSLGHINFYAQVREVNLKLPPNERIRVWLGDPSIDWSKIKAHSDLLPFLDQRDQHAASVIEQEILSKKKKALIIYGGLHFYGSGSLVNLVEKNHPSAFFLVTMYSGFVSEPCIANFEQDTKAWPIPAMASPVRGTVLEKQMHAPGCDVVPRNSWRFNPAMTESQAAQAIQDNEDHLSGVAGNAVLYLGPAASLTASPINPNLYLDADYRKEVERHVQIIVGQGLSARFTAQGNPVAPRYIHR
jgi:hypothetical protein